MRIVLAVPAHRDESGVSRTISDLLGEADILGAGGHMAEVHVCVNGPDPHDSPAARALGRLESPATAVDLCVHHLGDASKPRAWNLLRSLPADVTVFVDADVEVDTGSCAHLIAALESTPTAIIAAARQHPHPPSTLVERIAAVPHRVRWESVAGTLYAARTARLPPSMPDVLLDDAWLHATVGPSRVVMVTDAVARFGLPRQWGDLWRQRRRAEAGKKQLRAAGLEPAGRPTGGWRELAGDRPREWVAAGLLALVRIAALGSVRIRSPRWDRLDSTKPPEEEAPP